jgi:Holliday junction resolvasome RuvABC ATP-dependent DNA helicase subunit
MIEEDSLVSAEKQENEAIIMTSVRPKLLSEYIGQKLKIFFFFFYASD